MKKLLLILLASLVALAILPLIGNKVVESALGQKLVLMQQNGVGVESTTADKSYFSTKKHFELVVTDSKKFTRYLSNFSDKQIPSYVDMMLDGMHVGMDLEYSNLLFNDAIHIDIYPKTFSKKTEENLKTNDKDFYEYVKNFLKIKGLLYHVDYSITSETFKGYIKDIDEEYKFKDGTDTKFVLSGATYSGAGPLFHPSKLDSDIKRITLHSKANTESLDFKVLNIKSKSKFKTKTAYSTTASIDEVLFETGGLQTAYLLLKDLDFDFSVDTKDDKAEFYAQNSIDKLTINTTNSNLAISKFNYDVRLKDVDNPTFLKLQSLLADAKTNINQQLQQEISDTMIELVAKGFTLHVEDISVDKIAKDNKAEVDAFTFNALLKVKEDAKLIQDIKVSQNALIKNIDLVASLKVAKEFFVLLNRDIPAGMIADGFAKVVGKDYVFDVELKNSQLKINDKIIK
jgi:hypothetical protein